MSTVLVGLDIGYGNTKLAYQVGDPGSVQVHRFASGACPLETLPLTLSGSRNLVGGRLVMVDGQEWVAGIDSHFASGYTRALSDDYPSTTDWMALAHAAFHHIGHERIDTLVTGLPVNEYYSPGRREAVTRRLEAVHRISADRVVEVRKVVVVPQPLGAYGDWKSAIEIARKRPVDSDALVLVIDPGHYTVDWVLMQGASIRRQSSASSNLAGSELLRRVSTLLKERNRQVVSVDRLESRIRNGDMHLDLGSVEVDLTAYVQEAASQVVDAVLRDVRASLKSLTDALFGVVIAGGGASLYLEAVQAGFPDTRVHAVPDPMLSNARGFLQYARALRASRAA